MRAVGLDQVATAAAAACHVIYLLLVLVLLSFLPHPDGCKFVNIWVGLVRLRKNEKARLYSYGDERKHCEIYVEMQ